MNARGFTLLELLVIMVILAVLAGTLTLSIGAVGGERQLARQAESAQAVITYACEQAELTGRSIGVGFSTGGYRFEQLNSADWWPLRGGELRERDWIDGTASWLSSDGHALTVAAQYPDKPQIVCFSSGELTPFRLELALADLPTHYRIDGQPDGDMKLVAIDARTR